MKTLATLAVAALMGVTFGSARADLAPPKPVVGKPAPFTIEVDPNAKESRLVVPEKLIPGLRADAGTGDGDGRAGLDNRTIVAGVCLALALAFGGMWVVRSQMRPGSRYLAGGIVAVLALGAGAAVVWANAAPQRPPEPPRFPAAFSGNVVVEKHAAGNSIRLIVSPETLKKLNEEKKPAAPPKPE